MFVQNIELRNLTTLLENTQGKHTGSTGKVFEAKLK